MAAACSTNDRLSGHCHPMGDGCARQEDILTGGERTSPDRAVHDDGTRVLSPRLACASELSAFRFHDANSPLRFPSIQKIGSTGVPKIPIRQLVLVRIAKTYYRRASKAATEKGCLPRDGSFQTHPESIGATKRKPNDDI